MKKLLFIIGLLLIIFKVHAGELNTHFIADVENVAKTNWGSKIYYISYKLFLLLWGFETFYQCITKNLFDFVKVKELARFLVIRIIFYTLFTTILIKSDFYLNIIDFLKDPITHNKMSLDPSIIWNSFIDYWNTILPSQLENASFKMQFVISFSAIIYLLANIFLCFSIILIKVEIICIVYGALILTSCAGSKWTFSLWEKFLSMVISIAIKFMMFKFLYDILNPMITKIMPQGDYLTPVINVMLVALCLIIIPGRIAGAISIAGMGDSIALFISSVASHPIGNAINYMKDAIKGGPNLNNLEQNNSLQKQSNSSSSNKQPKADIGSKANFMKNK